MTGPVCADLLRRPLAHQLTPCIAPLRTQVDEPVAGGDHIQVVFDHQQRVALQQQPAQGLEQYRDVGEMKPGGGFVEEEQQPVAARLALARLGQVAGQLESLRLAAGEGGHRLAQAQVGEPHRLQRFQHPVDLPLVLEEGQRLADRELQDVGYRLAADPDLQDLVTVTLAVAVGAAQIDI